MAATVQQTARNARGFIARASLLVLLASAATAMATAAPELVDLVVAGTDSGLQMDWVVRDGEALDPFWCVQVRPTGAGTAFAVAVTNVVAEVQQVSGLSFYGAHVAMRDVPDSVDVRLWTGDAVFAVDVNGVLVRQPEAAAMPPDFDARLAKAEITDSGVVRLAGSSNDRVKITVATNALYVVTSAKIATALGVANGDVQGWIAATNLALTCMGAPVPWHPATGNTGVVFYGEAYRDVYTERNVYWLAQGAGLRMGDVTATVPTGPVERGTFWETRRFEVDADLRDTLPAENPMDPWYWARVRTNLMIQTPGAVSTGTATFRLWTRSRVSSDFAGVDGQIKLSMGPDQLGLFNVDGIGPFTNECSYAQTVLTNGIVRVEAFALSAVAVDHLIDSLTVGYRRRMEPHNGDVIVRLEDGTDKVVAEGFASTNVWVYGLTTNALPVRVWGAAVTITGAVARCAFNAVEGMRDFLLTTAARTPLIVEGVAPDPWAGTGHEVDYMVVAPEAFLPHLQPLLALRATQLRVGVLTTKQLYDNYNGGRLSPFALRDFVQRSRAWTVPPSMVLLAGSGHYDTRRITGYAYPHLTNHIATALARHPNPRQVSGLDFSTSDNDMVDIDGDGIPNIAVGRFPVRTTDQLARVVAKTLAYEAQRASRTNCFVFTDVDDAAFEYNSSEWMGHLPGGLTRRREITANDTDRARVRALTWSAINAGTWLTAYFGHANGWNLGSAVGTNPLYMAYSEVGLLTNVTKPVLFVGTTCQMSDAFVPIPSPAPTAAGSIGADLLRSADGGAVMVLAPSSYDAPGAGRIVADGFVDGFARNRRRYVGEAVLDGLKALRTSTGSGIEGYYWLTSTMVLFGDPALDIRPAEGVLPPLPTVIIVR
jgi:hypothetical protein